jgi:predicted AAA+ superfamily ATPase
MIVALESFYRTHKYLVEHVSSPVKRQLMSEIDGSHRLIGIKGCRGVGKTTFLLQYAKEHFGADDKSCLYINFNNFYFTTHSLVEFAGQFYIQGGRTLLIDQTFKCEDWSKELRECYERFPKLHIVFTGSTVMRLIEDNDDLKDIVAVYNLRGFSFREFIYSQTGKTFPIYSLNNIIHHHEEIAKEICAQINPFDYFQNYLHHGYYPFFLEQRNFSENLLKTMNLMIGIDIVIIKQIELSYLSKIRKLLYLLMMSAPAAPNVSQLSKEVEISRATIMNYIKYLQDARLLHLVYSEDDVFPKKPDMIYVHNTNLMHAVNRDEVDKIAERKTFLCNMLNVNHKVNISLNNADFLIDRQLRFSYAPKLQNGKNNSNIIYAVDDIEVGAKNEVPLWLFGFLY